MPGIRRDKATGVLYLNKSVNGKVYGESLQTTDLNVAKAKFFERLAKLASEPRPLVVAAVKPEKHSLAELIETYLGRLRNGEGNLDPKTVAVREAVAVSLVNSWAAVPVFKNRGISNLANLQPKTVTYDDLLAWRKAFLSANSPAYFNKARQVLCGAFDLAVEFGQVRENVVKRLGAAAIAHAQYALPTAEQWAEMLAKIDTSNATGRHCRDVLEGLSLTGLRISEARALRVDMVDLEAREIRLPAEIVKGRTGAKRGRTIDLIPEAHALLTRLVAEAGADRLVFKALGRKTLRRICAATGWDERFTLHSCRHFFATRMLEAGVPVQTVAAWLGHVDGGKLLLVTYAHLCRQHGKAAAAKVTIFQAEKKDAV